MELNIVTPINKIFSGKVQLVSVPAEEGYLEILPNHCSLVSSLKKGKIKITTPDNQNAYYLIEQDGGIIEVNNNTITILANKIDAQTTSH